MRKRDVFNGPDNTVRHDVRAKCGPGIPFADGKGLFGGWTTRQSVLPDGGRGANGLPHVAMAMAAHSSTPTMKAAAVLRQWRWRMARANAATSG